MQKVLNAGLYHLRHSREGGNPLRAVDPRLREDDGWELIRPFATASKAGIYHEQWIPAFAGMTMVYS